MIRLNSLDCKLKNEIFNIRGLYRQSLEDNPVYLEVCPFCGAAGECRKRGSYKRSLVTCSDGTVEIIQLKVPRVQCSCGRSHALLPDFIVPYLSYSLPMIFKILLDYYRRIGISAICEKYLITPPVLYRLKKQFLAHKKEWLGILRDMELAAQDFLDGLMESSYCAFNGGFLRRTAFSFLQSHRNPANCAHPHFRSKSRGAPCQNL